MLAYGVSEGRRCRKWREMETVGLDVPVLDDFRTNMERRAEGVGEEGGRKCK